MGLPHLVLSKPVRIKVWVPASVRYTNGGGRQKDAHRGTCAMSVDCLATIRRRAYIRLRWMTTSTALLYGGSGDLSVDQTCSCLNPYIQDRLLNQQLANLWEQAAIHKSNMANLISPSLSIQAQTCSRLLEWSRIRDILMSDKRRSFLFNSSFT